VPTHQLDNQPTVAEGENEGGNNLIRGTRKHSGSSTKTSRWSHSSETD